MFADGIGVPVTVAECEETGALGAAGVAGGLFDSLEAGVAAMVRPKTRYEPRPDTGGLGKARYSLYLDLAEMPPRRWKAYRSEIS